MHKLCFVSPPEHFDQTLGTLPNGIELRAASDEHLNIVLVFATRVHELASLVPGLLAHISIDGSLWICWPKRASKLPTDLSDAIVRNFGLTTGWVDVKVCAIDERWSALKFVRRLKDRV